MIIPSLRRIIPSAGPVVIPGSVSYTTPGTYSFTVPNYRLLTADARGASGGGGGIWVSGAYSTDGTAGGYSYFYYSPGVANLVGYGGGGGGRGYFNDINGDPNPVSGANGAHGSGANGDYNGYGDATAGGAGAYIAGGGPVGGTGGNGARAYKTWAKGSVLVPKSVITVVVGAGGSPGNSEYNASYTTYGAGAGVNGAVYISWS
jgi:hypothetical protein